LSRLFALAGIATFAGGKIGFRNTRFAKPFNPETVYWKARKQSFESCSGFGKQQQGLLAQSLPNI